MSRLINEIVVHCAATRPNWYSGRSLSEKIKEIRRWHLERGFNDIGYHWIIDRNGEIGRGRPESTMGAHVRGHNRNSIGICLLGGHGSSERDLFVQNFTGVQNLALRRLIWKIQTRYEITRISGHNEYAAKACPGFNVGTWLRTIFMPEMVIKARQPAAN